MPPEPVAQSSSYFPTQTDLHPVSSVAPAIQARNLEVILKHHPHPQTQSLNPVNSTV